MIEPARRQRLAGQALFAALFLAILFWRLLPLPLAPGRAAWPGPDLGLCLALLWVLRRPQNLPVLTVALLFLVADVLLMQPIGLGAAIAVIGTEAARTREQRWRQLPFMVEWLRVAILLALMMLTNRFLMSVTFLPLPALGMVIVHYLATVAVYPPLAGLCAWALGLRRNPAERAPGHG
ncbi:rod shape-determining protein MreD [Paracoccus sp. (in: a-proteobacteria)]|uniref:rod shape-determining protein MreD n=1 Tax=Paracoccus sp. TaxID=267 RepID=UPI0032204927